MCWVKSPWQLPLISQSQPVKSSRITTLRKRGWGRIWKDCARDEGGRRRDSMRVQKNREGIINCVRMLVYREITRGHELVVQTLPQLPHPRNSPKWNILLLHAWSYCLSRWNIYSICSSWVMHSDVSKHAQTIMCKDITTSVLNTQKKCLSCCFYSSFHLVLNKIRSNFFHHLVHSYSYETKL